VYCVMVALRL